MAEAMDYDTIYVAVGKDVEESKSTLSWAIQNFHGKFCILHVHQPSEIIPTICGLEESEFQRQIMNTILDDYCLICHQAGVQSEKQYIEMDDVGKGIVELIFQHSIKKLIMGAAANKHYSERMTDLKSKKALYVNQHMPPFCQIWFICRGHVIRPREDDLDGVDAGSLSWQAISIIETEQSIPRILVLGDSSTCSSSEMVGDSSSISLERTEGSESWPDLTVVSQSEESLHHVPTPSVLGGSSNDQLFDQLDLAMAEAEKLKREAFDESIKRLKAEKTALEALRRASTFERLYNEELRQRKKIEEELAKETVDLEKTKKLQDEERLIDLDHKLLLQSQVASSDHMMTELDNKLSSALETLEIHKKERDELQIKLDDAFKVTEELLENQAERASSYHMQQFFSEFCVSDIQEATSDFDPASTIGEGGYGSIYKGLLHHTPVAIKVLHPSSLQGPLEFQREVDILSKLRHPNLVTLIGACPEIWALIYEYLPNGNLGDRLSCRDNTPPLSWQTRIRIATELCSALIFLHSSKPHGIVHGDLKPGNILLDANFVCKLSDFGISRALPLCESSSNMTLCHRTDPKGTFLYLDPQFLATGELCPASDIYSFGIIVLQLLTGRSPLGIAKEVQDAIDEDNLDAFLDSSAGNWPFVQARQLAHLALRCCEMNRSRRPDLVSEVWRVLERMRASCRASSSFSPGSEEHNQPPSYFICPILQEVMHDPQVAADGFTYEAEALTGWLESGHDTSPMTNLRLEHHDLVPNRTLRSGIQEWLQQQQQQQH